MTKDEAIEAMIKGEKVTHRHFLSHEWIGMSYGSIVTDDGFTLSADEFWSLRTHESFLTAWRIFKPTEKL